MDCNADFPVPHELKIKKESPNEGTEIPNASGIIRQFLFT